MAKISSPWVGIASGKLGEGVFYHSGGRQCARARNRSPRNPKTAGQAVQRMVLATSSKMAAAFAPLIDHSFEGVPVGAASVQLFRKLAMHRLRSAAAGYLSDPSVVNVPADFAIKGAPIVGAVGDLQISRGSLSLNAFTAADAGGAISLSSALATAFSSQAQYAAELAKLGIEPGDQLTFVTLGVDNTQVVASFQPEGSEDVEKDYFQYVRYCRIVFKAELPENFEGGLLAGSAINPALVESSEGSMPVLSVETGSGGALSLSATWPNEFPDGTRGVMLFGVVRTKLLSNKKFAYSTCYMQFNVGFLDENDAYPTYMSYMDAVGKINVGEELYLRHAVAAPFV